MAQVGYMAPDGYMVPDGSMAPNGFHWVILLSNVCLRNVINHPFKGYCFLSKGALFDDIFKINIGKNVFFFI